MRHMRVAGHSLPVHHIASAYWKYYHFPVVNLAQAAIPCWGDIPLHFLAVMTRDALPL